MISLLSYGGNSSLFRRCRYILFAKIFSSSLLNIVLFSFSSHSLHIHTYLFQVGALSLVAAVSQRIFTVMVEEIFVDILDFCFESFFFFLQSLLAFTRRWWCMSLFLFVGCCNLIELLIASLHSSANPSSFLNRPLFPIQFETAVVIAF